MLHVTNEDKNPIMWTSIVDGTGINQAVVLRVAVMDYPPSSRPLAKAVVVRVQKVLEELVRDQADKEKVGKS